MKRQKYLTLCCLTVLTNVILGILVWKCYGEKSPGENSLLKELGMTCVYQGRGMRLYERNRDKAMFDAFAVLPDIGSKDAIGVLYAFPLPDEKRGSLSLHERRVVYSCGDLLFLSYVTDGAERKSSLLVQTKDSPLFYFPSLNEIPVTFSRVDVAEVQNQLRLLRITDKIRRTRND